MARPQRSLPAAVVAVVGLVGLLAVGWWLQPRLGRDPPVAPAPRPPPMPTSPTVATTRPAGSPGITKTAATALVDAITVTPGSVWIAAGGLVVRVDPVTRRRVVVPGIEAAEPPVVQLAAGAGAVWPGRWSGRLGGCGLRRPRP